MLRSAVSILITLSLATPSLRSQQSSFQNFHVPLEKRPDYFDSSKVPEQGQCWDAFRPGVTITPAAFTVCQTAIHKSGNWDAVSNRVLGIAYLNGLGTPVNKRLGLQYLTTAASQEDNLAKLYIGILYWNQQAFFNTETRSPEPMTPGAQETVAGRAIRLGQAESIMQAVEQRTRRGDPLYDIAVRVNAEMKKSEYANQVLNHYNPQRDGDSSVVRRNDNSSSTISAADAAAGALLLVLGVVGLAHAQSTAYANDSCTITYQTNRKDPTEGRIRPPDSACSPTY